MLATCHSAVILSTSWKKKSRKNVKRLQNPVRASNEQRGECITKSNVPNPTTELNFSGRRSVLGAAGLLLCGPLTSLNQGGNGHSARAAEELTMPQEGTCTECIGLVDETLGSCTGFTPGTCLSTFDDRPPFFIAPWEYPGTVKAAEKRIVEVVKLYEGTVVKSGDGYVYATFNSPNGAVLDDVEFFVSERDSVVVLRGGSRNRGISDLNRIKRRFYLIRTRLGWDEVPIIRNRRNKFIFFESPWDDFEEPSGAPIPRDVPYTDLKQDY